ncbi:MAG: hypothetical protein COU90_04230 [Candidatus Ryanbacteria bacterium CG10_big_fil_rev_8_21_14_0_10_43_42]|uniref:PKD domain-containing protein n=1 Tax=Candidatus Ryanbacteria bacterium CG10_big_fil_rev_8_21_14_0_10_43_42 TaxID=1974864 RepID=A0A2M8KVV2_9BACT|nr:MAG: hypothetical protein COU90_04230 [Candidatus Ryanbacteria bacterium CG10_big_fil_rev_8_21_14_0_10_43_42]
MSFKKYIVAGVFVLVGGMSAFVLPAYGQTGPSSSLDDVRAAIQSLLAEISTLQDQIDELHENTELSNVEKREAIYEFKKQLQEGMQNEEVRKLQIVLAEYPDIYPKGLVTGYFGSLTKKAVLEFQKKYGIEQAGEVGPKTRAKIRELLTLRIKEKKTIPEALSVTAVPEEEMAVEENIASVLQEAVPSFEDMYFTDTFDRSDAIDLGNGWTDIYGGLSIVSHHVEHVPAKKEFMAIQLGITGETEEVSAEFTSFHNASKPRFGVVLRYQDSNNYYFVYRQMNTSRDLFRIARKVNGKLRIMKSVFGDSQPEGLPFTLTGTVEGTRITLLIDGVEMLSYDDDQFSDGAVGIYMYAQGRVNQADNVAVVVAGGGITVPTNTPPAANAGSDQAVFLGDVVSFDASASNDPDNDALTYKWDFGDGQMDTGVRADHVYQSVGKYTVTLTVSDGQAEDSDTATVGVEKKNIPAVIFQGFGANTRGGSEGSIVRVTNLNDSGPGSLREALSGGNRTVVFDVAGDINLNDFIYVEGSFVTIDGLSAPAPGITLLNKGLVIRGNRGAHDVIVQGIRIKNSSIDGIQIAYGAYNVVIDHVSIYNSQDGNIDITGDERDASVSTHDVTVSYSILAGDRLTAASHKNMLIKYNASRVTLHHNLFIDSNQRNPQAHNDDFGVRAEETTLDMRNNIVWGWGPGYGSLAWYGANANFVNNYFSSPNSSLSDQKEALGVCPYNCASSLPVEALAYGYTSGNMSGDPIAINLNTIGNVSAPFSAPAVDTQDVCTAARGILDGAGARLLDVLNMKHVASVILNGC